MVATVIKDALVKALRAAPVLALAVLASGCSMAGLPSFAPAPAKVPAQALDADAAARLWLESARLTATAFPST